MHNGSTLTAEAARRLACDSGLHRLITAPGSVPLDMGRSERTVSPQVFLALAARDGGCIFPGCDRPPGWCQAHHIIHWECGGPTDVENLVVLCHHHHHLVHEGGWLMHGPAGSLTILRPDGEFHWQRGDGAHMGTGAAMVSELFPDDREDPDDPDDREDPDDPDESRRWDGDRRRFADAAAAGGGP